MFSASVCGEEYDLKCSERLWFSSSQEDIVRRQNSRVQFRLLFSSEETRSHPVFHDCHRESPECKLISQDRLGNFNVSLLKVFVPHFMRINC